MNESSLRVGEWVRLVRVPDWLVHDLPDEDRRGIEKRVGTAFEITEIDANGYVWMGFGTTTEEDDIGSVYRGQTFCVTPDCLEQVSV